MKAKEITITGSLAEDIAYFADEAGMEVEQYLEWALATVGSPLTLLDIAELLPVDQHIYLLNESDAEPYSIFERDIPDRWMEAPIKEIRSGGDRTLLIDLEDEDDQEDS